MLSYSLVLLNIGTPLNSPPPDFIGAAASRIYHGAPARFDRSRRKSDSGAAEGLRPCQPSPYLHC